MKRLINSICENAPCVASIMVGVATLVAAQTMTHLAPQVIETILGGVLIGIGAHYWGKVW